MSDIDTGVVDSLKVLDPRRPIREADINLRRCCMSAKCHKPTFALQQIFLFDHFVSGHQQARRHGEAERLRCFEIEDGFVFARCLHREVGGFCAP